MNPLGIESNALPGAVGSVGLSRLFEQCWHRLATRNLGISDYLTSWAQVPRLRHPGWRREMLEFWLSKYLGLGSQA